MKTRLLASGLITITRSQRLQEFLRIVDGLQAVQVFQMRRWLSTKPARELRMRISFNVRCAGRCVVAGVVDLEVPAAVVGSEGVVARMKVMPSRCGFAWPRGGSVHQELVSRSPDTGVVGFAIIAHSDPTR